MYSTWQLPYVTAAQETNNDVYARPTFKQTAFRHARSCFQTSLKKIGFHVCNEGFTLTIVSSSKLLYYI